MAPRQEPGGSLPRSKSSQKSFSSDYNEDGTIKTMNNGRDVTRIRECENGIKLYTLEPTSFSNWPKWLRKFAGWVLLLYFVFLFLVIPLSLVFLHPWFWGTATRSTCSTLYLTSLVVAAVIPLREWPAIRPLAQLWYELFDVSINLSPDERREMVERANSNGKHTITAMHPHGIVPFHGLLWASASEQYLQIQEPGQPVKWMYGFAAAASAVFRIPLLRNLLGWFATHGASYHTLRDGLLHGKCVPTNNIGRIPQHLYLLPGGVAEVFVSTVGRQAIVFKERRGICKLAIECNSEITPIYIFGVTDIFYNLAAGDSWLSKFSRKWKLGLTYFWGHFGLPIPFTPRMTIIVGKSLPLPKGWSGRGEIPERLIDEYHAAYLREITNMFDKYKAAAGYPDAQLEVF